MKAVIMKGFGGPEQLELTEMEKPEAGVNEVLIQVKNAGVNPVDWKIREGMLQGRLPHKLPIILGWDVAGIVEEVGPGVSRWKKGDEVYAYCRKPVVQMGTYAEYIAYDADQIARKPRNLSFAEAASIPLAGLTAWQSLFEAGHLEKGDTVLIHAGAGGVGSLAIQLAKQTGTYVFSTAREENHAYVGSLGADLLIDYTTDDFVKRIKQRFPEGLSFVFDTVGGETAHKSLACLKPYGRFVSILEHFKSEELEKKQIHAEYVFVRPDGKALEQLTRLFEEDKIVAPTLHEIPLAQAADAQELSRTGHTKGKIVLHVA